MSSIQIAQDRAAQDQVAPNPMAGAPSRDQSAPIENLGARFVSRFVLSYESLIVWRRSMGTATFIQDETEFDALLAKASLLVVDCTATWCGPCKLVGPLMDRLADEYGDRAQVFKLDLDTNKTIAKRFGIKSIPAVMVFKQGELLETLIGVKPYEEFTSAVERHLAG
jgi:thioredoxin 1